MGGREGGLVCTPGCCCATAVTVRHQQYVRICCDTRGRMFVVTWCVPTCPAMHPVLSASLSDRLYWAHLSVFDPLGKCSFTHIHNWQCNVVALLSDAEVERQLKKGFAAVHRVCAGLVTNSQGGNSRQSQAAAEQAGRVQKSGGTCIHCRRAQLCWVTRRHQHVEIWVLVQPPRFFTLDVSRAVQLRFHCQPCHHIPYNATALQPPWEQY